MPGDRFAAESELPATFEQVLPKVAGSAFIAPGARLIGDITVGEEASIWYGCILRADVEAIRIGAHSNLQDGTIVHVSPNGFPTEIGEDVLVGHGVILHGCRLEHGSYIGIRATILNGCVVESGAIVAPGAVISERTRIPAGQLWGGVPGRYLRDVREAELAGMQLAVRHYVELGRRHARLPS